MAADVAESGILIFGATGQVGRELPAALAHLGPVIAINRAGADFTDPDILRAVVRRHHPRIIINAAAYTAVDRAESEPELAQLVNGEAPAVLAQEAESLGACLVHYSTDYVFDGRKPSPYTEGDSPSPLSAYGRSKLIGEDAVAEGCHRHLILRTSWVFAAHGANFLRTMLRLGAERDALNVVVDQHGAPTPARLIADVTAQLLDRLVAPNQDERHWGLYHLSAAGETTWHAYASYAIAGARTRGMPMRATPETIHPISTVEYPTPAARPANSRLDTAKLRRTFHVVLPDWQQGVDQVLDQLTTDRQQ